MTRPGNRSLLIVAIASVLLLMAITAVGISGCNKRAKAPEHLRILFTTDTLGYFTPCGCAGGPRGGFERRSTAVEQAKADALGPVILLDTGNFSTGIATNLERTKASFVARAMVQLGYDAANVGLTDAKMPRLGVLRYQDEYDLPLTSAGFTYTEETAGERAFSYPSRIVIDRDGFKIGIIGHPLDDVDPGTLGIEQNPDVNAPELLELMQSTFVEDGAQIIILVTDLSRSLEDARLVGRRFELASVVIAGASAVPSYTEEKSGADVPHPLVVPRAANWGRSLGVLDLDLSPSGGIVSYRLHYIDLNDSIEKDTRMADLTEEYLAAVEQQPSGIPEIRHVGYVGSTVCRDCHAGEYEQWSGTRHAGAWDTLEETGRLGEATCIPCHVTGFMDLDSVPERMVPYEYRGVGCESCHGPGQVHIQYQNWLANGSPGGEFEGGNTTDPIILLAPEETCTGCHVAPYDEGWMYQKKVDRIRHE
jgi:hypothetical protein